MKKGFILFAALFLLVGTAAFAKVTAVKEGDVVKVTWTYENKDAGSVGLVGDFQGWNLAGAKPMTKDANGVWSITLEGKTTSEYKYKFNVDGEWTEDPTAPVGVDDGFGGTNGYAVVAELLGGASTAGASGPKGLVPAFFMSSWAASHFITQSADDKTKRGLELADVSLNAKAYFGWDGYLFPNFLKVSGEIRLFRADEELADKSVYLYRKIKSGTGAVTTVELWDGLKNIATMPWNLISQFNQEDGTNNWPSTKGKVKFTFELKDLNAKIAHSIGWMKPTKIKLDQGLVRYFGDPDANAGITEVFNATPLSLGKMNYFLQFDLSAGALSNRLALDANFGDLTLGGFSILDYATSDLYKIVGEKSKLDHKTFLTGAYKMGDLKVTGQAGIRSKNMSSAEIEEPYFGGLQVEYAQKDKFSVSAMASLAGMVNINAAGTGGDSLSETLYSLVKGTLYLGDLSVSLENKYTANYKTFSPVSEVVTLGGSVKMGDLAIGPTVKVTLPIESNSATDDVVFNYLNVTAKWKTLDSEVRWSSGDSTFKLHKIVALTKYGLDEKTNVGLALAYQKDEDDTNNPFGFTMTFDTKTDWETIKSPMFFAVAEYNIEKALDSADGTVWKKDGDGARDISAVNLSTGAVIRTGLRWSF